WAPPPRGWGYHTPPRRRIGRWSRRSAVERGQDGAEVAIQELRDGQAEAGEDRALDDAVGVRLDANVFALDEAKPIERLVEHPPDDVLLNAVAPVRPQL